MYSPYHTEWLQLMKENQSRNWDFVNKDIVERVLSANPHYARCTEKDDNSGLCKQVRQFREYVEDDLRPPKVPGIDYGETAYVLWLLGIRLPKYASALHARVDEFFKGSTYYESDIAGFRQFLYEAHGMCRLVEADMQFKDLHEEQGEPDFLVMPGGNPFYLEIKMPVSNLGACINKAFKQLQPEKRKRTALLVGLDSLLQHKGEDSLSDQLALAEAKARGKSVVIVLEFPRKGSVEGGVDVDFSYDEDTHDPAILDAMRRLVLCHP